ncbi:solute carrier family 22 member 2-like [Aricia agestis]|uniref:solute carrier family 22 member 2-like n=1 Tax=Aricia agestis TaxID=91739 RepID=UPI001C20776F|nr:solute carrier family 22 member 2-like [Aricia agestis]
MCKQVIDEIKEEKIDISSILEKAGRFQAWMYLLSCLPAIFVSMLSVNFVFVAGHVNHRCRVPECEGTDSTFLPTWWPSPQIDSCSRPILNESLVGLDPVCTNTSFTDRVEICTDWVYENNDTVVADLNLGCQPWKVNFIGTAHGIGMIIAMLGSGYMCDRIGRKPTLIICAVGCILGNLKIIAKSYNVYVFLEFLEGAISTGSYTAGAVLLTENSNAKTRILAGVVFAYAIYMGEALFAVVAMHVPNWKNLLLIICTPSALFLSYTVLLKESPRWQIINGKIKDAKETLKTIARVNKLKIDAKEIDDVTEDELRKVFNLNKKNETESFKEMFRSREILKRLVAGITWRLAASFIYYSLVINSVLLPGDKYTVFLLTALTSFPGELISMYLMNKIGRRKPLMTGFLVCGMTCVASAYVPEEYRWVKICLFLFGKLLVSACYTGTVVYTMELFPTSVRGSCVSLCTLASCAGSMLAPLTPALTVISPTFSSYCFAFIAMLASALLIITPETKGTPLLDTIYQLNLSVQKAKELKKGTGPKATDTQVPETNAVNPA